MHRWRQKTDFLGEFFTDTLDTAQQFTALPFIHQRDQTIAHFQPQCVYRDNILPGRFFQLGGGGHHSRFRLDSCLECALCEQVSTAPQHRGQQEESKVRHAGNQTHAADDPGGNVEHLRLCKKLVKQLSADILIAGNARNHDTCRSRDQQRGNLRNQAIANRQQGVILDGSREIQIMLNHAYDQAADNVDDGHHDAGHRIAAHILAGTVHRAVELGFLGNFGTPLARFLLTDQAGVQIGVNRHLLAGHGIQGEARADFRDAPRALGDDHEIDYGQNDEHHDADRVIATDQEVAESLDHLARGVRPGVPFGEHYPGRGYVEREPQHGADQQNRREHHEIKRFYRIQTGQQHDDGKRNVETEKDVERKSR